MRELEKDSAWNTKDACLDIDTKQLLLSDTVTYLGSCHASVINDYVFFNKIHPTASIHKKIAYAMEWLVNKTAKGAVVNFPHNNVYTLSSINELGTHEIVMQAGKTYSIEAIGKSKLYNPYVYVLDNEKVRLAANDNIGFKSDGSYSYYAKLIFKAYKSGVYYVGVNTWEGLPTGTYQLIVDIIDMPPVNFTDVLESIDKPKIYGITMQAGKTYSIEATGKSKLYNPYVYVLDNEKVRLAANDDIGIKSDGSYSYDAKLTFKTPKSGVYYVGVNTWEGLPTGTYQLIVETLSQDWGWDMLVSSRNWGREDRQPVWHFMITQRLSEQIFVQQTRLGQCL